MDVTVTEFRLLSFLIGHADEVVTRRRLIGRLWDNDERYVDENTLSVYIRRLREKLVIRDGAPPLIHTVRVWGYRWGDAE